MKGIPLTNEQRKHLLLVYESSGARGVRSLARKYGVTPDHVRSMAREKYGPYKERRLAKIRALVKAMASEFRIAESDLLRSRYAEHCAARSMAMKRLRTFGFGVQTISNATGLAKSSVEYWVYPHVKVNRQQRAKARYERYAA